MLVCPKCQSEQIEQTDNSQETGMTVVECLQCRTGLGIEIIEAVNPE